MTNQLTNSTKLNSPNVHATFAKVLGSKANQFVASLISATSTNPNLNNCDFNSLVSASMICASLDLPATPSLGFAYLVPYSGKVQFQIGYKGLIQLCIRSGQFKNINTCAVYEDDTQDDVVNRLTSIFVMENKSGVAVKGYAAYFKLLNGFEKTSFMSKEDLEKHAKKYSKSYNSSSSIWRDNFEAMATKTVLKLLLGKFAPMNVEIQTALESDQKVDETYADNSQIIDAKSSNTKSELTQFIETEVQSSEALLATEGHLKTDEEREAFQAKLVELQEAEKPKTSDGSLIEAKAPATNV